MLYVCLDKNTKKPMGTVEVLLKALPDWEQKYDMLSVDESYRGKHPHELKYENSVLRHSTQQEIDSYFDSIKPKTDKEKLLDLLNDLDVVAKLKGKVK